MARTGSWSNLYARRAGILVQRFHVNVLERNNVKVFGRGSQPMMFAHGFGCDQNMWRFVTPAFQDEYRIVLFDYVGSGKSDVGAYDAGRYSALDGYAQDVLDICHALDLRDVVLVGHSVSSMVAVLAANREPERFASLVLIGPSPRYINDPPGYVGGFDRADIEGLLEMMDKNFIGWASFLAPNIMKNPERPELGEELTEKLLLHRSPHRAGLRGGDVLRGQPRGPGARPYAGAGAAVLGRHDRAAGGGGVRAPRDRREHAAGDARHRPLPAHEPSGGNGGADPRAPPRSPRLTVMAEPGQGGALDEVLDQAPFGFLSLADDGTLVAANRTALELLGYGREDLLGRTVDVILTVGARMFYQTHLFPLVSLQGSAEEIYLIFRTRAGEPLRVLLNARRRTAGGLAVSDWAFLRIHEREKFENELLLARRAADEARAAVEEQAVELEIQNQTMEEQATELEASHEELAQANAHLAQTTGEAERARRETAAILSATSDGILGVDAQGRTTFANPAAERLLGWRAAEMMGRPQHELIHHSHEDGTPYPADTCPLYHARRLGEARRVEGEVFWRKDGTSFPVEYEMLPLLDGGVLTGGVVTFRDITARWQAQAERERLLAAETVARELADRARAEAESANRAKSEFLANMSHELRTPINAIIGYADLLTMGLSGEVNAVQQGQLERIRASGRHLLGLINDVLDTAKVEAGQMNVAREVALLDEAVAAALAFVEPQAVERGLVLVNRCTAGGRFMGDDDRVRQILTNLLSNAVKFTQPGGRVTVTCGITPHADTQAHLKGPGPWAFVRVEDSGIGVPAGQADAIFEPFVQAESGRTRTRGGTGLGLTISRRLARLMDGDLTLDSRLGEGSCFTLWLPAAG